jgi:hypothetical protein
LPSLLDFSVQNDPFAPMPAAPNPNLSLTNNSTGLMSMTMTMNQSSSNNNNNSNPMMSMMQTTPMHPTNDLASGMGLMSLSGTAAAMTPTKTSIMASNEDRYSALNALATAAPTAMTTVQDAKDAEARLLGFGPSSSDNISASHMGMAPPPSIQEPMVAPGSGHVAATYGSAYGGAASTNNNGDDDDDNPWVMGGRSGMGLQPVGPVPTAPPPPPPPDY